MHYAVPCQCGRRIEIGPGQAGAELWCKCGNKLYAPALSQLRAQLAAPDDRATPEMVESAHQPVHSRTINEPPIADVKFAGFWIRLAAYLVDVIPILMCLAAVFYLFFGFDETLRHFRERGAQDMLARTEFLSARNQIRDLAGLVYLVYAGIMEASPLGATFGKRMWGLRVIDENGRRLSQRKSLARNFAKLISILPCGMGLCWIGLSKTKRGWHDSLAGTYVIVDRRAGQPHAR